MAREKGFSSKRWWMVGLLGMKDSRQVLELS